MQSQLKRAPSQPSRGVDESKRTAEVGLLHFLLSNLYHLSEFLLLHGLREYLSQGVETSEGREDGELELETAEQEHFILLDHCKLELVGLTFRVAVLGGVLHQVAELGHGHVDFFDLSGHVDGGEHHLHWVEVVDGLRDVEAPEKGHGGGLGGVSGEAYREVVRESKLAAAHRDNLLEAVGHHAELVFETNQFGAFQVGGLLPDSLLGALILLFELILRFEEPAFTLRAG